MRASSLSSHLEKAQTLRDLDAEVIVVVGAVVNAGPSRPFAKYVI